MSENELIAQNGDARKKYKRDRARKQDLFKQKLLRVQSNSLFFSCKFNITVL